MSFKCPHGWHHAQSPCPLCTAQQNCNQALATLGSPAFHPEDEAYIRETIAAAIEDEREWFSSHGFPNYRKSIDGQKHTAYEAWEKLKERTPAYRSPMAYRMFVLGWLCFERKLAEELGKLRTYGPTNKPSMGKITVDKELDAVTSKYMDADE